MTERERLIQEIADALSAAAKPGGRLCGRQVDEPSSWREVATIALEVVERPGDIAA